MESLHPGYAALCHPEMYHRKADSVVNCGCSIFDIEGSHATHAKPRDQYMVSRRHIDPTNPNYDQALRPHTPKNLSDRHPIMRRGSNSVQYAHRQFPTANAEGPNSTPATVESATLKPAPTPPAVPLLQAESARTHVAARRNSASRSQSARIIGQNALMMARVKAAGASRNWLS